MNINNKKRGAPTTQIQIESLKNSMSTQEIQQAHQLLNSFSIKTLKLAFREIPRCSKSHCSQKVDDLEFKVCKKCRSRIHLPAITNRLSEETEFEV